MTTMPLRVIAASVTLGLSGWCAAAGVASQSSQEGQAAAAQDRARRVLLVTGQDYPGHPWRQTAPALRSLLEEDPRLRVTVTEDPAMLDSAALAGYDAVVLHFMNWQQPSPGPASRENLSRRVSEGMGLVLVHFACGAWQDWPEFRNLAGRVWDPKLTHDPHGVFRVDIVDSNHPITRGMPPFETRDELYSCLTGDRPIHLLATARSKVDGKDYPMAFVLEYGKGRVFHTVLGHDLPAVTNPAVARLMRRGCAWAAGLEFPPE
jgi:type 1 glutamine amidotransferase